MANICDCTYKITGSREAVLNLYNAIKENDDNQSNVSLYKLAEHYGIDYEKRKISVRGSFISMNWMSQIIPNARCLPLRRKRHGRLAHYCSILSTLN